MIRKLRLKHKLFLSLCLAAVIPTAVVAWGIYRLESEDLRTNLRESTQKNLDTIQMVVEENKNFLNHYVKVLSVSLNDMELPEEDRTIEGLVNRHNNSSEMVTIDSIESNVSHKGHPNHREKEPDWCAEHVFMRLETKVELSEKPGMPKHVLAYIGFDSDKMFQLSKSMGVDLAMIKNGEIVFSTLKDQEGNVLHKPLLPTKLKAKIQQGRIDVKNDTIIDGRYLVGSLPLRNLEGQIEGGILVAAARDTVLLVESQARRTFLWVLFWGLVFALGLASGLSRRFIQPLSKLQHGAKLVSRGQYGHQIDLKGHDEIVELADSFDHMTRTIAKDRVRLAERMAQISAL